MKYVIVIPDGAADLPVDDLDGRTPFEAARTPYLDALSAVGRLGTVATTPGGLPCGSDICCMSLLGYDPRRFHTGRAPLEAAALGIALTPRDWIFRLNLVTVLDGAMQDHSAGHISTAEGEQLLAALVANMPLDDVELHPGVSYRNIMVDVSGRDESQQGRDWSELATKPPHDIPGEAISRYLPHGGKNAKALVELIEQSGSVFAEHEVNLTRREMDELPATHVWPWGQGRMPKMPSFERRFGLRGAMITAVDLLAGISHFIGWDRLDVPGQTSYHDNDYEATGKHAVAALDDYDIICAHVEAPDEASHAADVATKVAAIEAIDQHVIGPVHAALQQGGEDWRMLVLPDHYTRVDNRKHDPTPVPFVMAGHLVHNVVERLFSEASANEADLHIEHGHELMEYFLFSGLK
ncbi:MAG: cofactor-independent phosphoglycerate mutase [Rhodospirillales bacterium]|nr:cofactor-independent phosphoglycerate mutase [Rhodospirillales bacterium]